MSDKEQSGERVMWGINEGDEIVSYMDTDIEELLTEYAVVEGLEPGEYTTEVTKGRRIVLSAPDLDHIIENLDENMADGCDFDESLIEKTEGADEAFEKMFMEFASRYLVVRDYWIFDGESREIAYLVKQRDEDEIEIELKKQQK